MDEETDKILDKLEVELVKRMAQEIGDGLRADPSFKWDWSKFGARLVKNHMKGLTEGSGQQAADEFRRGVLGALAD